MTTVSRQYTRPRAACHEPVEWGRLFCACGLVPMTLPCHGRDRGLESRHALQTSPRPARLRQVNHGPIVSTPARVFCTHAVRVEIPVGPPLLSGRNGVRHLRFAPEPDPISTRLLKDRMRACEVRDGGSSPPESARGIAQWQSTRLISGRPRFDSTCLYQNCSWWLMVCSW